MRVDYHLHPNLPRRCPEERLCALWDTVAAHRLDVVVSAEHVFKDAPNAYRLFAASRPKGMHTHVLPGAELLAKDHARGIDVVAFGEKDWYDEHPRLLQPYAMTLEEMIRYLNATNLRYFIPHPLLSGTTLKALFPAEDAMAEFLASVPAIEAFNGGHLLLEHVCETAGMRRLLRGTRARLRRNAHVSPDLSPGHYAFLAVGSDAHHPREVGFCVGVPGLLPRSRADVFRRITTNTDITKLHIPSPSRTLPRLLAMGCTTLREGQMRQEARWRAIWKEWRLRIFVEEAME